MAKLPVWRGVGPVLHLDQDTNTLYHIEGATETPVTSPFAGHNYHDDVQGVLQTALVGVTAYTFRQLRNTGMVFPHIATNDIFSMTFQFPHKKTLETVCDSVHIHYIPVADATGDVRIDYTWGWWNPISTTPVPDTLPNTGTKTFSITAAERYYPRIASIITDLDPPEDEHYSSLLLVKCQRVAPAGTDYNGEFALIYKDAHYATNRFGSYYEYNDG